MPVLTFPARPTPRSGRCPVGTPDRAQHCQCQSAPWPDGDECVRCGKLSRAAIDRTWQHQALILARLPKRTAA